MTNILLESILFVKVMKFSKSFKLVENFPWNLAYFHKFAVKQRISPVN